MYPKLGLDCTGRLINFMYFYFRWPTQARRVAISEAFREKSGLDGIVGSIDGTHIRLVNLPGGNQDYYNRRKFPSTQLQLVIDDMLLINSTYVGWPGMSCIHFSN